MHPVLFKFKGLTIHTYGVLVALGFLIGITYSIRKGKKEGIESDKIFDLAFYLILSAIIGSRALYVLMNFKDYSKEPLRMLMIWEGGLVFYGGLILAVIVGFSYMKIKKMEFWKTTDVMAPGIALGHAIGRLGCFNAGCCYGKPSHVAWAVTFRDPQSLAPKGIPLHPV
ncbi:MAG: prolipoprotein diacylglyceryl transferase, partial [Spirochaetes bacterium]